MPSDPALSKLSMPRPIQSRDEDSGSRDSPSSEGTWLQEPLRLSSSSHAGDRDVITVPRSERASPAEARSWSRSSGSSDSLSNLAMELPKFPNTKLGKAAQVALLEEEDDKQVFNPPRSKSATSFRSSGSLKNNLKMPRSLSYVDGKFVENKPRSDTSLSKLSMPRAIAMLNKDEKDDDDQDSVLSDLTWVDDNEVDIEQDLDRVTPLEHRGKTPLGDDPNVISVSRSRRATPIEASSWLHSSSSSDNLKRPPTPAHSSGSLSGLKMPKPIHMIEETDF